MTKFRLFALSFLVTCAGLTTYLVTHRFHRPVQVGEGLFIAGSPSPADLRRMKNVYGVQTVIDLRPDGEAADQIPSAKMAPLLKGLGLAFHYIPIPHEGIPDGAVAELSRVLAEEPKPMVLYCRTGRRAVRTLALAEASQPDGPGGEQIEKMVRLAGFSAEDLRERITARIARRNAPSLPAAEHDHAPAQ